MTYCRAQDLIDWLPGESRTKTAMREAMPAAERARLKELAAASTGHGPWSSTDLLLAEICDRLQWVRHSVIAAGSKDGKAGFDPEPIPRPGVEPTKKKLQTQFADAGDVFGVDMNVVTEDRIDKLRRLREMRGTPDGGGEVI